jgi:hypothetical protein
MMVRDYKRSQKSLLAQSAGGGQVFVLGPHFNPSEYLGMRVEDPAKRRERLNPAPAFLSRYVFAGDLEPKSCF